MSEAKLITQNEVNVKIASKFVKIQRIYPENFSNPLNKLYPGGYVAGPWFEEATLACAYSDEH